MTNTLSLSNDHGMTLFELLISTIIVGFMVGGIFSAYFAMQSMDRGASRRAYVIMELRAVAEHMRHNIAQAYGTSLNPGIDINNGGGVNNWICARQDTNLTPGNFADDQWACYTWRVPPATRDRVYFCLNAAPGNCAATTFVGRSIRGVPAFNTATGLFSMLLINRFDNSAGEVDDLLGNPTQGDEVNPQAVYRLQVHPDAHSFR
jgi:type II secretory pathway pseudopilin PulG